MFCVYTFSLLLFLPTFDFVIRECCVPNNTTKCYHFECVVVCHFCSHYRLIVKRRDSLKLVSVPEYIFSAKMESRKQSNSILLTCMRVMISSVIIWRNKLARSFIFMLFAIKSRYLIKILLVSIGIG